MRESEPKRQIPKEEARDWDRRQDQSGYADKGGHKERSIANDPKHIDHWRKENARKTNN